MGTGEQIEDTGCWRIVSRYWVLENRYQILGAGEQIADTRSWRSDIRYWVLENR
jgi:hypothetical protein